MDGVVHSCTNSLLRCVVRFLGNLRILDISDMFYSVSYRSVVFCFWWLWYEYGTGLARARHDMAWLFYDSSAVTVRLRCAYGMIVFWLRYDCGMTWRGMVSYSTYFTCAMLLETLDTKATATGFQVVLERNGTPSLFLPSFLRILGAFWRRLGSP